MRGHAGRHTAPQARSARSTSTAQTAEIRIEALAAGGAGVGRIDGAAVLIPATAPGDLVEVRVNRRARLASGSLLRVLERGPDRVDPACPFVPACGGCDWMHLRTEAQQAAHAEILHQALVRGAGFRDLPAIRVHAAPRALGYRTRARLFAKTAGGDVRVGYRSPGTHALTAVDRCLVLCDELAPLLADLPRVLRGARGDGDVLVARGDSGRAAVEISWRGELAPSTWAALDARIASGDWAGARVTLAGAKRPAVFGDPRPVVQGADGRPLVLAAGGFGQPSEEGAAVLAQRVAALASAAVERPQHVVELFAGSGTLSILLARGAASFTAIERSADAIACLRQNLADRGLAGRARAADADAQPIPARVDLVVLDPPRGGATGAAAAIATSSARVVVYVSCDPATLARDLRRLAGRFEITDVEIVELFPQTSHVEAVVRLVRAR